jgi:hypothetical protein
VVNPRRAVVEDRALALADILDHEVPPLAARIREVVPETFSSCDEQVPLLRALLTPVSDQLPRHKALSQQVLAALDDLPGRIGRRGQVWVARDGRDGTYSAFWDCEQGWLEQGPQATDLGSALDWARQRCDDVRLPPADS